MQPAVMKHLLRTRLIAQRTLITDRQCDQASRACLRQIMRIDWSTIRTVCMYSSISRLKEIDTQDILCWIKRTYPKIVVEVIDQSKNAAMPLGQFDLLFIPVVGFNRGGFRLGMGGGWYDRFLVTQEHAHRVGLAYAWAELDDLPAEAHDQKLDYIVTPTEYIDVSAEKAAA